MKWDWAKFYDKLNTWVVTHGPRIMLGIVILFIGIWVLRLFNRWVRKGLVRYNVNPSLRYFLQNLIAITMQILLVLMVMQIAGIQLTFFAAIIAGLSVAIGLALSGTLQNFVSGVLILVLKPYRVGENINTQGQEGTVTSIQLFYTTVLTFDNKTIIIPNGQLSNNVVINLSREGKRRLDIDIRFPYKTDVEEVKNIIEETIRNSVDILQQPPYRIGVTKLDPDRYTLSINIWINATNYYDTVMLLNEKFMKELKAKGKTPDIV